MPFISGTKTTYASANTIRIQAVEIDNTALVHDFADFPAIGSQAFALQVPEYKNYLVQILEFVAGNPVGNVIGSYVRDARKDCQSQREDIEIIVDGGRANLDPVAGATEVNIPGLAGEIYRIEKRQFGPLIEGVEFTYKLTGGFILTEPFQADDVYVIQFFPPGTTANPDIIITVDGTEPTDPVNGTYQFRDVRLKDKPGRLVQRGFGTNRQFFLPEISIHPDGGFDLLDGRTFQPDDVYFWQFYPTVCTTYNTATNADDAGELIVTANTVYDIAHRGKVIQFRGAGETVQYELPGLDEIPAFTKIRFEANGGAQVYGKIKTKAADVMDCVLPNQVSTTYMHVAKGEHALLMKGFTDDTQTTAIWKVLELPRGYDCLGEDVVSSGILRNALAKDGLLRNKATYQRIWDWFLENSDTVKIITDAEWNTITEKTNFDNPAAPLQVKLNSHKVADVDANNFRMPDDREYYYRIGNHTTGATSEAVWDQNQKHDHGSFDGPSGKLFDQLLTDDVDAGELVTTGPTDYTPNEPNVKRSKPMATNGAAQVLVRSVNKIAQIKI